MKNNEKMLKLILHFEVGDIPQFLVCVFHCANAERKRMTLPFPEGILPLLLSAKGKVLDHLLVQTSVP